MNYEVAINPYLKGGENVTVVAIKMENKGRYSYEQCELPGDHTQDSEDALIQAVLELVRTELDPTSAIVKNQEQLAKTTEALERANQLMDGMQKVNLQNAQDIEDILARLEELEAQGESDQEEKEEDTPQVTDTEKQTEEAQPTPAVEDKKESEKEDDISETTNQESPSEDNGGSSNE
ncbi:MULTISPECIES: hypothetical protein [Streptococcus]|uniref:Phage protein n=1 Tax=Streptococcus pseudopneumoniae TaxID=257758 RepID=A0AAW4C9Z1_9STRE|nr:MULTISPECIES: hypothetical protein [Streptococcus]ETE02594.1 hypothetical protein U751_11905 [Streptococcus pseudopneumoniae 22725]MBF9637077.1 hypothetical protein [Streptococcus pseudopneumoniae]MBF9674560.1 hypothetical protein [Streptococcus pseudopneumoniae]MBF9680739.1 hypothetical protein [Streptococcus pseudopneumoniae]MBW8107527.1 hypothetical protein [Streptococcus pseudopneumoniae]